MPKKKDKLVTVLTNGKLHFKCTPAMVRKMLQKMEAKVISIDPFIVNKVKIQSVKNKSNNKGFKR